MSSVGLKTEESNVFHVIRLGNRYIFNCTIGKMMQFVETSMKAVQLCLVHVVVTMENNLSQIMIKAAAIQFSSKRGFHMKNTNAS